MPTAASAAMPPLTRVISYPVGSTRTTFDSLTESTIDTGAFAQGIHDFSRFVTPGECVGAAEVVSRELRRNLAVQYHIMSLRDTAPDRDTLPQQVVAFARSCGTRFTVEQTERADLPALFTLALMAGEDSLARKVVARRLALATDANERQVILTEAVAGYVAAEPARFSDVEWAVGKADTLAVRDHTNSLPAHVPLLEAAYQAFDRPRMLREAKQLIALGQRLSFRAIEYADVPLIHAWANVLEVAFVDQPDSVLALAQAAKNDLSRFPSGFHAFPNGVRYTSEQLFDFKTATVEKVRNFLLPFNPQQYGGTRALPPVVASYWFPEAPKMWPPKGAISLVIYGEEGQSCARSTWNLLSFPLSYACAPWHTYLPKWAAQYDSLGFSLLIVERTYGHAVRSVVLSPSSEADSLNWYYRTYLKLPATVAVVSQAVSAESDGRRWFADTTAFGRFLGPNHGRALLFDRDGILLYAGEGWRRDHALLNALIMRATHPSDMDHGKEIK